MHRAGRAWPTGHAWSRATLVLAVCTALAALATPGCQSCNKKDPQGSTDGGVGSATSATPPPAAFSEDSGVKSKRPTTTSWSIAGSNLDGQIAADAARNDYHTQQKLALVNLYLTRGQTLANVEDYEKAEEVGAGAVKSFPKDGTGHLAHALGLSSLHRFEDAAKELDEAAATGVPASRVASARVGILMATGRYDEAQKLLPALADDSAPTAIITHAVLAAHMQKPDEAEKLFERGRNAIVDVSPFPVAWMDFQRAMLLEAAGKEKEARGYYLEALEAIPVYTHAAVHASVTDAPDRAIERLEAIRKVSTDPDVLAALADAHKRAKHDAEAKKATDAARARYEELLAKHPEAYADHAARFYLGAGNDSKKALDLAAKNAKLRPTEEAIDLWMAAAAAAQSKDGICASALAMKDLRYASEQRKRIAAAASNGCSDAGAK